MRNSVLFIVGILGSLICISFIPTNTAGGIEGTVYSRETGDPLGDVQVTIDTDKEDGQYEFRDLESRTYLLKYHKNGYRDESQDVNVRSNEVTQAKDVRLYKKPAIGSLLAELEANLNQKKYGESELLVASINRQVANSWETLKTLANRLQGEYRQKRYEQMRITIKEIQSEIEKD